VLRLDCDAALTSGLSRAAGLPLAGWGVLHFGTLAALRLLADPVGEPFRSAAHRAAFALALAGGVAGVALTAVMLVGAAPFCPLCAAAHATSAGLVLSLVRDGGMGFTRLLRDTVATAVRLLRPPADADGRLARAALACVGLTSLVLFQGVHALAVRFVPRAPDPREALAAEAARLQGKFSAYHDALFASPAPHDEASLRRIAQETGLDLARFDADRAADAAARKVADDVALATRLGVDETRCVFLNGRRVPDVSPAALHLVLGSEFANRPGPLPAPRPRSPPPAPGTAETDGADPR
jgi:vitamin K epoxide reductase family protein/DSBA-like thioredoxin domain-containing protein